MAAILTDVGLFATTAIDVMGDVVTFMVATPIVLIPVIASIALLGVGLVKKFI